MRVKRGVTKNRKHKKVLKKAKGFRLTYSKLYRRAREALLHSGQYSFNDRRKRGGQFRKLWIQRINGALTKHDVKYSRFIKNLSDKKIELNRKMLSELAVTEPAAFDAVVEKVK